MRTGRLETMSEHGIEEVEEGVARYVLELPGIGGALLYLVLSGEKRLLIAGTVA